MRVNETIEMLLDNFHMDMGKRPAGIILGPKQYLELCEYCQRQQRHLKDAMIYQVLISEYMGYPVYVKELPGVDLMIAHTDYSRYLI